MKKILFKLMQIVIRASLAATLCFASLTHAQSDAGTLPPLTPQEQETVIEEIKSMVKTDATQEGNFIVREATPTRIDRLFNMPEVTQQPRVIRENGLIFAGQGELLRFDKPSDVITKVSSWFPDEVAAARASKDQRFFGRPNLHGPFANWKDEPAAFLALWHCAPQIAWLRPDGNPFMKRLNGGLSFLPIAARSSSREEFDFGFCIHQRSGYVGWGTEAERRANQEEMRRTADRVAPVLRSKFAHFLSSNRCRGTGPDDCVLILHLWASLSPADTELANAIQTLEADVAPDSPLPPLQRPVDQYGSGGQEGEHRFDEALRKAAFLRSKLLSVLNAPSAWPVQALPTTLHQMTLLRQKIAAAIDYRWGYYELDYSNEPINPWGVLSLGTYKLPHLREVILAELNGIGGDVPCAVFEQWFQYGGESMQSVYALQHMIDKKPLRCAKPDWAWLKRAQSEAALDLRNSYLDLLGNVESGAIHEMILSNFTDYGKACFDKQEAPSQDWLRKVCKRWISEPQTVSLKLKHGHLTLSKAKQFHMTSMEPIPQLAGGDVKLEQEKWLSRLVQGMSGETTQKMQAFAAELSRRKVSIFSARQWSHPRHSRSLIELHLKDNEGTQVFLVIEPHTITTVGIPERFRGENNRKEIVHVSDLDEDGNLEVWWAESFRQCHNDDTDLEREFDCTAKTADMGEIKGDTLSYFSNTPQTKKQTGLSKTLPSRTPKKAAAMEVSEQARDDNQSCNTILIGAVLVDELAIDFGGSGLNGGRGDVIGLVCKPHPLHPEQTIVALFHDLKDKQGESMADQKGFALAVLDVKLAKVHRLYRDTIEEDASIRVTDSSLRIDTGRYNLAPGVRAFGVRMNIGYGPRCAEAGESNYLTLFVEEGRRLKPVLKDLPMSSWSITEGSNCGNDDADYAVDNVELTLTVSATLTNGWRDLELIAHHLNGTVSATTDSSEKQQMKTQVLGILRAKGKMYSRD